jgi:arylsulfatase A-like enzyme
MTRETMRYWMLVLAAGCTCGAPAEAPQPTPAPEAAPAAQPLDPIPEGPNVLIVLWDTARADRMSVYGHDRPTTPKLAEFAAEAAVFEHAISPGMWTLPTHASFFTGLPPQTHGASATHRWLDDHHETLAERFDEAGWDTFAFSSNLVAGQLMNVTQGFDKAFFTYKEPYKAKARAATLAKLIPGDSSTEMSPEWKNGTERDAEFWDNAVYKDAAPLISSELLRWLDERQAQDRPFFAYVNFMEAHTPRVPSKSARERVLTPDLLQLGLDTDQSLFTEVAWIVGKHEYTDRQLEAIRGVYDASLVDLDDATAELFAGLEARGVLDDTIVVVLSDHG